MPHVRPARSVEKQELHHEGKEDKLSGMPFGQGVHDQLAQAVRRCACVIVDLSSP